MLSLLPCEVTFPGSPFGCGGRNIREEVCLQSPRAQNFQEPDSWRDRIAAHRREPSRLHVLSRDANTATRISMKIQGSSSFLRGAARITRRFLQAAGGFV